METSDTSGQSKGFTEKHASHGLSGNDGVGCLHKRNKSHVSAALPLYIGAGPHDLNGVERTVRTKELVQPLLRHQRVQRSHVQIATVDVAIVGHRFAILH